MLIIVLIILVLFVGLIDLWLIRHLIGSAVDRRNA